MDADSILRRFGCIHKTVHGDGADILGRIVLTCEEMLKDRGCDQVFRADDLLGGVQAGAALLRARGGGVDVNVYIHGEERVGVKAARMILDECEEAGVTALLVSIDGPTPFTRKEFDGKAVQFMDARSLCYNVTRHALVPKHVRVEAPPAGVEVKSLPKLLETDAVVQYYGWPVGTVVRVSRCFGGHEPIPYFRVVSPNVNS